jgi:Outer membrane protein and related peptidoglycan-associated (lipo)proteins
MNRFAIFCAIFLLAAGCSHNSNQAWEDVKTAGRYMQRSVDTLWGKNYESRMLTSDEEFVGPYDDDFIPLRDSDLKNTFADTALPQPKGNPGERGIPSLDLFYAPSADLRSIFQTVHFETDEHVLKEKSDLAAITQIATYLKKNPNVYVVIRGHTDERASAGYNMALGTRRSNYIRSLLVKAGVDLNRVYAVSRGKEEPIAFGHTPDEWKQNRRAEFRIFERQ